jgi:hypothetical protein
MQSVIATLLGDNYRVHHAAGGGREVVLLKKLQAVEVRYPDLCVPRPR